MPKVSNSLLHYRWSKVSLNWYIAKVAKTFFCLNTDYFKASIEKPNLHETPSLLLEQLRDASTLTAKKNIAVELQYYICDFETEVYFSFKKGVMELLWC